MEVSSGRNSAPWELGRLSGIWEDSRHPDICGLKEILLIKPVPVWKRELTGSGKIDLSL